MSNEKSLTEKIREGLIKSGFPLEMKVSRILNENEWTHDVGRLYNDFETGKVREIDLSAEKTIRGISIQLEIACKKSTERQLLLYAPQNRRDVMYRYYFKMFPTLKHSSGKSVRSMKIRKNVLDAFQQLPVLSDSSPMANKLIVASGNKITEDNVKYLSDFNGLVKHSIITGSNGLLDTEYRVIYLYLMIFEGGIFQVTPDDKEDFAVTPCEYGRILYEPDVKYGSIEDAALHQTAHDFGSTFIIEVMTPEYLKKYLERLNKEINSIDAAKLEGWGRSWPDYRNATERAAAISLQQLQAIKRNKKEGE